MKKIISILTITLAVLLLAGCMPGQPIAAVPGATPLADMPDTPPGLVAPEIRSGIQLSYFKAPGAISVMSAAIAGDMNAFAGQYVQDIDNYVVSTVQFLGNIGLLISGEAAVYAIVPYGDYLVIVSGTGNDVILFLDEFTVAS